MSTFETVDFVVCGLDDRGRPSGRFLKATEVAVLDERGKLLGRFRDAESLTDFLIHPPPGICGEVKLVATQTSSQPRSDLVGRYYCERQASWATATPNESSPAAVPR